MVDGSDLRQRDGLDVIKRDVPDWTKSCLLAQIRHVRPRVAWKTQNTVTNRRQTPALTCGQAGLVSLEFQAYMNQYCTICIHTHIGLVGYFKWLPNTLSQPCTWYNTWHLTIESYMTIYYFQFCIGDGHNNDVDDAIIQLNEMNMILAVWIVCAPSIV